MRQFGLAQWLEVINGAWAMASLALLMVCLAYLAHEVTAQLARHRPRPFKVTLGMRVAIAVGTLSLGILITRFMIWLWRVIYGAQAFADWQLGVLVFGASVGLAGFILAIREYSRPLFGDMIWILSVVAIALVAVLTALPNFMR